jgi:hypothetical protein
MDLLACTQCGDRFYAPGAWLSDIRDCPHCGGGLRFSLRNMASIPLDARGIDHGRSPGGRGTFGSGHKPIGAS